MMVSEAQEEVTPSIIPRSTSLKMFGCSLLKVEMEVCTLLRRFRKSIYCSDALARAA